MPAERNQPWHKVKDAYGAQLWDIEPSVQVAGIGIYKPGQCDPDDDMFENEYFLTSDVNEDDAKSVASTEANNFTETNNRINRHGMATKLEQTKEQDADTSESVNEDSLSSEAYGRHSHEELGDSDVVILDGCHAATVHWDQFRPVWHAKRLSTKRKILKWILRLNFIPFIVGIVLTSVANQTSQYVWSITGGGYRAGGNPIMTGIGALFLIYSLILYISASLIIRTVYGGKFWETQPYFFGFEGYMPIGDIESKIFGMNKGRLAWSPHASSPLSHHAIKDDRWVVPQDPLQNPDTRRLVESKAHAKPGDSRVSP
jgi:hypothetical protein